FTDIPGSETKFVLAFLRHALGHTLEQSGLKAKKVVRGVRLRVITPLRSIMAMNAAAQEIELGSPARVAFLDGQGELPMLEVTTAWGAVEMYFQGAHITRFQKRN